jgi:hypothetical protein
MEGRMKTDMDKLAAIRALMDHPQYQQLRSEQRLTIIRKIQDGLPLSWMLLLLSAHHWVETGVFIERKGSEL